MSNDAQRTAIAAAADGVTAGAFTVTAHDQRPTTAKAGDAWVRWRGAERSEAGFSFYNTWALVVILPADEDAADSMADALAYELAGALEPVMSVEAMTPVIVATSAGDMKALHIQGTSE